MPLLRVRLRVPLMRRVTLTLRISLGFTGKVGREGGACVGSGSLPVRVMCTL